MYWNILENKISESEISSLSNELNVSQAISKLLILRGVKNFNDAKLFFRPSLEDLHSYQQLLNATKAIDRIISAINNQEKILIYGDYDVDGTTSVSLVYCVLSHFTKNLLVYIPDRYNEGYGISYKGIDYAIENNCTLCIVLDCGTKEHEKIQYATDQKLEVIICDHHTPAETLPNAYALINPKQPGCYYPYKELSACGVGFKLMQGFIEKMNAHENLLFKYLDLVAISIASDIVPITGENRILAYYGLKKINEEPHIGIEILFQSANFSKIEKTITDLVFTIGPRINAAGRIDHGKKIVQLLTSTKVEEIIEIAREVDVNNSDRKSIDQQITLEALSMIEKNVFYKNSKSQVLYNEHWHKGVVGIVASRVIEHHYKPTIVLTKSNGKITGSARSVKDFDVYQAIEKCSDCLVQFGGHKYAAGLTLLEDKLSAFMEKFEQSVSNTILDEQLVRTLEVDLEINFYDITPKFIRILKQFAPHGPENMKPVFVTKNVIDNGYTQLVGKDKNHIKFNVVQIQQKDLVFKGVGFNMAEHYQKIKSGLPFQVAYTLEENYWNGQVYTEMNIKDLKFIE